MKSELIAYASSFAAFLLGDKAIGNNISRIILFGSVARGDFDRESDIDIFVETGLNERLFQKQLSLYNKSKLREFYELSGIKNEIVLKVGRLEKWKGLHESIAEDGIVLYGKYEEKPKELLHFTLFKISVEKRKFSSKVKIWRRLYGYKQKVGRKAYVSEGLLQKLDAVKLAKGIFLAPFHNRQKALDFLDKNKIGYEMFDIYRKGGAK